MTRSPTTSQIPRSITCRARGGLVCTALGLLVLSGCATVQPDVRFADVQRVAQERLGQRVVWDRGGPEGAALRAVVDGLLAPPLTTDGAVQVALLTSNALQAIFEELGVAQAELVQAGLVRNPSLAGFFRVPDRPPSGVNWNVGLDFWPLDVFLIPLRKRLAGAALDAAELRVSRAILDLAARTRTAYYTLWVDEQTLAAQRVVTELAEITAEFATRQYAAGNIDDLRLASERATSQRALLALEQAQTAVQLSRERLRRILGLTASDRPWHIVAEQTVPAADDLDAEALLRIALGQRLDLVAAKKEVEGLEYGLALTRKWWLAPVRVGVEAERGSGGQYQIGPHFQGDIPVFDQKQAEIARQEALVRQARRRMTDLEGEIRMEVRNALERMRTARRAVRYYQEEIVPLRMRITEMTEQRYQSMILGVFEMLTAKSDEADARIAAARATSEFWTARADLELAVGTRLPEPAASAGPRAPADATTPPGGLPTKDTPSPPPPVGHPHGGAKAPAQ